MQEGGGQETRYCLAHGLITLHLRTEEAEAVLPAALHGEWVGEQALVRAGPRVRRVARWDRQGWQLWWDLLAQLADGRPAVAALPPLPGDGGSPPAVPRAYLVPATVALRAASSLVQGVALYLGAFAWEMAAFDPTGMEDPVSSSPGLEPLYREIISHHFQRERRPLLPLHVPGLLQSGFPLNVEGILQGIRPVLEQARRKTILLGGEDRLVVAALATALREDDGEVAIADPLVGLERLVDAVGGIG